MSTGEPGETTSPVGHVDATQEAGGTPAPSHGHSSRAHVAALRAVHEELGRLEELLCGGHRPISSGTARLTESVQREIGTIEATARSALHQPLPAWLRPTLGESRWPVAAAITAAIALQLALPDRLSLANRWLLPSLELALLVALIIAAPHRFSRESRRLRLASLTLTGLVTLANAWSAARLVEGLVAGHEGEDAAPLLTTGAAIWLTNVIAFALWYWQFDRGGPAARAHASTTVPDFQFPQMQSPELAHPEWEPGFVDYLYLSFTNATAFSPTDVLPLSRWAKLTMLAQSLVSLVTVALVIARAVNILK
jgi:uncharacterized membrane protein